MKKIFSMLALLLMAVTGAWAQTEELLTSITTDFMDETITYSTAGCATLTTSGEVVVSMAAPKKGISGWTNSSSSNMGSLTVTPSEGYTITKVVFKGYEKNDDEWFDVFTDTEAPYTCYMKSSQVSLSENMANPKTEKICQIDVYGYANAPATKYDLTKADGSEAHGTVAFTVGGVAAEKAKKDDVVTVSVAPNEGYSAKDVTVKAYTSFGAAGARGMRRAGENPEMINYIDVTKNEENGTWQFTMPEADVEVEVTYTKTLQDAWIQAIADQTYTGSAITPAVVKDGETTLTAGTDYTVAYSNNVNVGEATVTVTGIGSYSGEITKKFNIVKADITMTTDPAAVTGLVYSGEAQILITPGEASFGTVVYSLDGTNFSEGLPQATDADTYTVTYKVEGDNNHNAFAAMLDVTIAAQAVDQNNVEISVSEAVPGEMPVITVAVGGETLAEGTDYDVTYKDAENNPVTKEQVENAMETATEDATYTATITLKGNYSGSKEQTLTVKAVVVATLTIPAQSYATYYAGKGLNLDAAAADADVKLYTVTGVSDHQVTLAELTEAAKETPLIIYNGSEAEQSVTLKVKENATTAENVAAEFNGSLVEKTFTGEDMQAADYYVLSNGHNFVWVKDAGTIAANKCWIELPKAAGARRLSIVTAGEATGIAGVSTETADGEACYDLSGRRVVKPAKGLYIMGGKKVVVK